MTKLLLMRHSKTDWNRRHLVQGQTDIPLNEEGRLLAEAAARQLAGTRIARIYTSELSRAEETARIVARHQKGPCKVIRTPWLNEQNFGRYEGVNRQDADYQKMKGRLCRRYDGGGESYFDVAARVYPALRQLAADAKGLHADETLMLVTHNGILRVIANYFLDFENEEFIAFGMDNCEVRAFEL